jgi:hypothetical protein
MTLCIKRGWIKEYAHEDKFYLVVASSPTACVKNISNLSYILFPKYFALYRSVFSRCQDLLVQECQETHHETGG